MLRKLKILLPYCLVLLLVACQKEDGLHQFQSVDIDGWDRHDTLVFQVPASSALLDYDLQVEARITQNYTFRDLWVVVEQHYDTAHAYCDTVHMPLTDSLETFNGQGRTLLQYNAPVRFLRLQEGETGEIRIHHIMDNKTIAHVHDIGVNLSPIK